MRRRSEKASRSSGCTSAPGHRVYFLQDGDILIVLLAGGDKSTQQSDIEKARELANEW